MYSSKVIKDGSITLRDEPFCLSAHTGHGPCAGEDSIGSRTEAIEKEAYQKGFRAGERAGFEFGEKKAEVQFGGLEAMLAGLSSFRESLFGQCEKDMVRLCLAIAKKMVQREVEAREDGVLECVRAALRAVVAGGEITIRVSPKEYEVVSQHRPELLRSSGGLRALSVEPDEQVGRGGCVIATNYGEIDSTIASITLEIEERLSDAYRRD